MQAIGLFIIILIVCIPLYNGVMKYYACRCVDIYRAASYERGERDMLRYVAGVLTHKYCLYLDLDLNSNLTSNCNGICSDATTIQNDVEN